MGASGFRIAGHTADVALEAWGSDAASTLAEAARGVFSLLCDLESIEERTSVSVEASAVEADERLVHFLQECLSLFQIDELLICRFEVRLEGDLIRAVGFGERYDPNRHRLRGELKAVTYHQALFECRETWTARVIIDI